VARLGVARILLFYVAKVVGDNFVRTPCAASLDHGTSSSLTRNTNKMFRKPLLIYNLILFASKAG
jgi:hypothetical protein